jgi:hypothetical protein
MCPACMATAAAIAAGATSTGGLAVFGLKKAVEKLLPKASPPPPQLAAAEPGGGAR